MQAAGREVNSTTRVTVTLTDRDVCVHAGKATRSFAIKSASEGSSNYGHEMPGVYSTHSGNSNVFIHVPTCSRACNGHKSVLV